MSDLVLELIGTSVIFGLIVYNMIGGRYRVPSSMPGWKCITAGFVLLLLGNIVDICDDFPSLNHLIILGDTRGAAFLEKIVGSMGGLLLVTIGFWQWLPVVKRLESARIELADSRQDLKNAHDRIRIILDSLGEGVVATDEHGIVKIINPSAQRILGADPEELLEQSLENVLKLEGIDVQTDSEDGKTANPEEIQMFLTTLSGERIRVALQVATISNDFQGTVVAFRDITARHEQEMKLRQSSKMESVGRLAGGIAHDFNNQLMGILGNAELMSFELENDDLQEYLTAIKTAGRRAADLTSQLLAFSRGSLNREEPVDMKRIMAETEAILSRSMDKRIRIRNISDHEDAVVRGEATQLQNAVLNLCINACDAMPNGGDLTMQLGLSPVDDAMLRIDIIDTGQGMDSETQKKIFEPFFTTKVDGKGTGLGLASVYGTVKQHHGQINVVSSPGRGATFSMDLPRCVSKNQPEIVLESKRHVDRGAGNFLIVDDDLMACEYMERLLQRSGYSTVVCRDSLQALAVFESQVFDGVILDMIMPGKNGMEIFRELRGVDEGIPVILVSGYGIHEDIKTLLSETNTAFLQKPIHGYHLLDKIQMIQESKLSPVSRA
jgi:two-component system, cell cycle sensor histidine kinase and response regulator CckA